MDWNHDGKHDYKDHAFYNNVISTGEKKTARTSGGYHKATDKRNSGVGDRSSGRGWFVMIVAIVLYLIIKAIGRG